MKQQKVTFNDIAQYTGFSKTTISRYFNNPESITVENQEIIQKALEELNYKENKVARILASGKTEFVGIILPNLQMDYYSHMLDSIIATFSEFGYKFLVYTTYDDIEKERAYINELMAYRVEGLFVLSHLLPSSELAELPIPVVSIEREAAHISSVDCENYHGGRLAAEHLHSKGCDVYLHVNSPAEPNPLTPAYQRIIGFQDYCMEHGLTHENYLKDISMAYITVTQAVQEVLDSAEEKYPNMKKGIFFSSDTYANELVNQLIRRFHKIPDDYYIVGFNDTPISRHAVYPISTIRQDVNAIAHAAVTMLVEQMNERKKRRPKPLEAPVHVKVPVTIVERYTTSH